MFAKFFYTCKAKGLNITLSEWLTLQEALDKGLCESSLTQFYYLARMILVKSETDFDKYDMAFEETFKGINSENEISKNMMKWLDKSELIELVDEEDRFRMNGIRTVSTTAAVFGLGPWERRPLGTWAGIWEESVWAGRPATRVRFR